MADGSQHLTRQDEQTFTLRRRSAPSRADAHQRAHVELLVETARLYYEHDLKQEEIARRLHLSRPSVSRLLAEARQRGIVTISVGLPADAETGLEKELIAAFGLTDARVVVSGGRTGDDLADQLGRAAADYLDTLLADGMVVGTSNGRTLAGTAHFLRPKRPLHLTVVQIIGALSSDNPMIDGPDIARTLAASYRGICRYLHAPLLVRDAAVRHALTEDPRIRQTLDLGRSADVVLVGVGAVNPAASSPLFEGLRSDEELHQVLRMGAVGHLCGEHFDAAGQRLEVDLNDRVIGIGMQSLKRIPSVIAVAGGADKGPALLGALAGGYINVLVTDDVAAQHLLRGKDPSP